MSALPALADETAATDLAMQLSNPVAALISVPLQSNYDQDIGPVDDGDRWLLNVQPVIPFSLNDEWNLISRTILPVVYQTGFKEDGGSQFGLGLTTQSFFFSPKQPTHGVIWGVGPAFQLPTATDDIAHNQWGAGVTGVDQALCFGVLEGHDAAGNAFGALSVLRVFQRYEGDDFHVHVSLVELFQSLLRKREGLALPSQCA